MLIIGVDISLRSTGVAMLTCKGLQDTKRITTTLENSSRAKLAEFADQWAEFWGFSGDPDLIVVEEPIITRFNSVVNKTLATHGVFTAGLAHADIQCPLVYVHPTTLKKLVTGFGRAEKDQMQEKLEAVTGRLLQDDECDAAALAIVGQVIHEADLQIPCVKCKGSGLVVERAGLDPVPDPIECPICEGNGWHLLRIESQYAKIKTAALEASILQAFGMSQADLDAMQLAKSKEYRKKSYRKKKAKKLAERKAANAEIFD